MFWQSSQISSFTTYRVSGVFSQTSRKDRYKEPPNDGKISSRRNLQNIGQLEQLL